MAPHVSVRRRQPLRHDAAQRGQRRLHRRRVGVASPSCASAAAGPNIILSLDGVFGTGLGDKESAAASCCRRATTRRCFAGLNYLHGNDIDPADPRRSLAKQNWGINLGYTYALNDSLALNTVVLATYRNSESPDGIRIPAPRERYALQLGTTWMLARGLFLEPQRPCAWAARPDFGFSLNVPRLVLAPAHALDAHPAVRREHAAHFLGALKAYACAGRDGRGASSLSRAPCAIHCSMSSISSSASHGGPSKGMRGRDTPRMRRTSSPEPGLPGTIRARSEASSVACKLSRR